MLGRSKSIRTKLTLWYALILLTTLVAFGLIAYTYSSEQLAANLDRSLSTEVKWVKTFIEGKLTKVSPSRKYARRAPVPGAAADTAADTARAMGEADELIWNQIYAHALVNPKKTMIEVTNKWGAIVFRSFTAEEETLNVGEVPLNTIKIQTLKGQKGSDLRVAATRTSDLDIYVAYPLSELADALDNLYSIFLILIPVALTVSVAGGWLLAYQSLKPVDEITRTVQEITAQRLDRQIPPRKVNDEIGRLIGTFNGMIVRLRDSFDRIRQFSADASHELRTPLTIMRGEVELALRTTKEPEEYRRVLASNLEEIVRLSTIVEDLLTLSRAELQKPDAPPAGRVNLRELMSELYEDCELMAEKKEITLEVGRNEDLVVPGDRLRLRQLFLNLIDNAIKYTPEHGKVTVTAERENGHAAVRVQDTGIGIPEVDQGRIFDRFFRVDKARTRELGGSGLGLSIAKWIVELHNGKIEVESEPAKGSTFTVILPL